MFLRTILFIGPLHLLCFTNVASPMVLLTANVEDIKKIARKFLSENVADTIAEFLIKATGGLRNNNDQISEENDQNQEGINNISVEGNLPRASERRPTKTPTTTPANDYVDYDVKTTAIKKKTPGPKVYNTPAFESNTERLDGDFDEDIRLHTKANYEEQIKQEREIDRQRINTANDEEQIKQERDMYRQRINTANDEEQIKQERDMYRQRINTANDEEQIKQERDMYRQRINTANDEEQKKQERDVYRQLMNTANDEEQIKQERDMYRQQINTANDEEQIKQERDMYRQQINTENDEEQIKQERDVYRQRMNEDEKYDETTTVGGDHYDVETKKPRQSKYSDYEEEQSVAKYTSSPYSKKGRHRLIATSGSIILPRIGDASQE